MTAKLRESLFDQVFKYSKILWRPCRSSRSEVFCRKAFLKKWSKFTGKHLCQSLFFNKVAGLRPSPFLEKILWYRCTPVNFAKLLRTPNPFFYRITPVAAFDHNYHKFEEIVELKLKTQSCRDMVITIVDNRCVSLRRFIGET